jgi:excisionase family DNA binding protein
MEDAKPFLNSTEVATRLNISRRTVRQLAQTGILHGIRVGKLWRFDSRQIPGGEHETSATRDRPIPSFRRRGPYSNRNAASVVQAFLDLGFSQKEIAASCGISQSAVSRLLSNQVRNLSAVTVASLSNALQEAIVRRLGAIFQELDVTVVAVSSDDSVESPKESPRMLDATVRGLVNSNEELPRGVRGVVLGMGQGNYLIRVACSRETNPQELLREVSRLIWHLRETEHTS